MQIKDRKAEEDRKRQRESGPIYLTEEGFARLESQLERLKRNMPALIEEATRTAAYGDRSDNAEYKDAKGRLRGAQWRALVIQDQLKRVTMIPTGPNESGTVQMGSTVVLETAGARKTFRIVGPEEANPDQGYISFQSPLGAALLDHKIGDAISLKIANGAREYRILEIN